MTGRHAQQIRWLASGYDFRVHGFYAVDADQGFLEALCGHSVPPERLVDAADSELRPARCMDCLLAHGSDLADEHGDGTDWQGRRPSPNE